VICLPNPATAVKTKGKKPPGPPHKVLSTRTEIREGREFVVSVLQPGTRAKSYAGRIYPKPRKPGT
jgi:hypothetical protein